MTESTGAGPSRGGERGEAPEVEATLVIASETPAVVAEEIAGLDGVGPYRLEWRGVEELRDVYLDTADEQLRDLGLALRLRRGDGGWRIALKGPARPVAGGAVERRELEVDWSPAGFRRILEAARDRGVEVSDRPSVPSDPHEADPVAIVRDAGFRPVQDRRTRRRRAGVLPASDEGDGTLAWLVLDTVLFRAASGRRVRHREVEIEATPAAPEGLPGDVAARLRRHFRDALRPWEHSKLATGAAVAEIDPTVGPEGDLLPVAYDRLEQKLSGSAREA